MKLRLGLRLRPSPTTRMISKALKYLRGQVLKLRLWLRSRPASAISMVSKGFDLIQLIGKDLQIERTEFRK